MRDKASAEPALEAVLTREMPGGGAPPADVAAQRAFAAEFQRWWRETETLADDADDTYAKAFRQPRAPASSRAAAAARRAQIHLRVAEMLARAELLGFSLEGPYAHDAAVAYCDALADRAEQRYWRAFAAAIDCRRVAAEGNARGWWDPVCSLGEP